MKTVFISVLDDSHNDNVTIHGPDIPFGSVIRLFFAGSVLDDRHNDNLTG